MSVYVDDARIEERVKGGPPNIAMWSHMWADTEEELEKFAKRLGLNPKWIQGGSLIHYDLVESKRKEAIKLGAIPLSSRAATRNRMALRQRQLAKEIETF